MNGMILNIKTSIFTLGVWSAILLPSQIFAKSFEMDCDYFGRFHLESRLFGKPVLKVLYPFSAEFERAPFLYCHTYTVDRRNSIANCESVYESEFRVDHSRSINDSDTESENEIYSLLDKVAGEPEEAPKIYDFVILRYDNSEAVWEELPLFEAFEVSSGVSHRQEYEFVAKHEIRDSWIKKSYYSLLLNFQVGRLQNSTKRVEYIHDRQVLEYREPRPSSPFTCEIL